MIKNLKKDNLMLGLLLAVIPCIMFILGSKLYNR